MKLICLILMLLILPSVLALPAESAGPNPINPAGPTQLPFTTNQQFFPNFTTPELPNEQDMSAYNRSVLRAPARLSGLIQIASLRPTALDAGFNQTITLGEALAIARENSYPIRISRESYYYQRAQLGFYSALLLPTNNMNATRSWSEVNGDLSTTAFVYTDRVTIPVFVGGNYAYWILGQNARRKGWKEALKATTNDTLLDVYNKYTNLILNHHLLLIRLKSVDLSTAQVVQQKQLYAAGTGTRYNVMQAETQLASDKQALIQQQVATRQSALLLAYALNLPLTVNLVPTDMEIENRLLIRDKPSVGQLLNVAFLSRPELREYEYFRQAAAHNVQLGSSYYYPNASFFLQFAHSQLNAHGNVRDISGVQVTQIAGFSGSNGSVSNTALGQTASLSPGNDQTASTGANTGAATIVASSGGTPIANTQSGTLVTSGAAAPGFLFPIGIGTSSSNVNGTNTSSFGSSPGYINSFQAGFSLTWSFPNLYAANTANLVSLRALSRQALLQSNQEIVLVNEQVRAAYLNALSAFRNIESLGSRIDQTAEALRLAQLRLTNGVGTQLELIQAQRDYVDSLTTEAQSTIQFQQAQAQLLHDCGVISVDTLTQGFSPANFKPSRRMKI